MKNPVIKVENISKVYHLGGNAHDTLYQTIANGFKGIMGSSKNDFYALNNISFSVNEGCVLGVIGPNGAGKSTLLKILSKITVPTTGRALIKGNVSSLLEVGTGFHHELSGRENIYLNGAILGMSRKNIKDKYDEIVEFSGLENFLTTPIKHYSSGMYARLAFSVAAHLSSDILVVDEILSVGDLEFRNKCMGKMSRLSESKEKTILFVSHNMSSIVSLCDTAILLDHGQLIQSGSPETVINAYTGLFTSIKNKYFELISESSTLLWNIERSNSFCLKYIYTQSEFINTIIVYVSDQAQRVVLKFNLNNSFRNGQAFKIDDILKCKFESTPLYSGRYYLYIDVRIDFAWVCKKEHIGFINVINNLWHPVIKEGAFVNYKWEFS